MHPKDDLPINSVPVRDAYVIDEARILIGGISRAKIYELFNTDQLQSVAIAGRRLVPRVAIEKLLNEAMHDRDTVPGRGNHPTRGVH